MKSRLLRNALCAAALATTALTPLAAVAATPAPMRAVRRPRATIGLSASRGPAWIGQPIPVTVTAIFRDVEGVTLEGAPTLTSKSVITSDVAKDPRQSTEIIDGERMLVARWAATVTPSTAGPLDLEVALPVQLKYREAPVHAARPAAPLADPFGDDDDDPFGSMFAQMRKQLMEATTADDLGRVREEAVGLKASLAPLDVRAIPTAGQPATFSGAVGTFAIDAKLESGAASVSEPLTLRVTVTGDVNPDRVEIQGVPSSSSWKTYPPHALAASPDAGVGAKTEPKVFEQILVPLRGGDLTVPAVSFTAFDPKTGAYVTHATDPLEVTVSGTAPSAPPAATPTPEAIPAPVERMPPSLRPFGVAAGVLGLIVVLGAAIVRLIRRRRPARALRLSMRRAAAAGSVEPFLGAAHELIAASLAARWHVAPSEVTAATVRERLGRDGTPLADVLVADAALRFGRGGLDSADLAALARAVEVSLAATARTSAEAPAMR